MPPSFLLSLLPFLFGLGGAAGLGRLALSGPVRGAIGKFLPRVGSALFKEGAKGTQLGDVGHFLTGLLGFTGGSELGEKVLPEQFRTPGTFAERLPLEAFAFGGGIGAQKGVEALLGRKLGTLGALGSQLAGFPLGHAIGTSILGHPGEDVTEPKPELSDNQAQLALLEEAKNLDPGVDNFEEIQDLFFRLQAQDILGRFV